MFLLVETNVFCKVTSKTQIDTNKIVLSICVVPVFDRWDHICTHVRDVDESGYQVSFAKSFGIGNGHS